MIIIIRHSDDESDDCSRAHDCQLAKSGRFLANKVGRKIIHKYGLPDLILVSPFRRTLQTMRYMIYNINYYENKIIEDKRLSRYFSSRDKQNPDIDEVTRDKEVPIYEDHNEFKERVKDFIKYLTQIDTEDKVIWVITHVVVYKRLCRNYGTEINGYVPFMEYKTFKYCRRCKRYHLI